MPASPQDILAKVKGLFSAPSVSLPALPTTSPLVALQQKPVTLPSPESVLATIRAKSTSPTPASALQPQPQLGTPFTQAVSKQAAEATVKALPKAADAIGGNLANIRDVFTGKLGMTPADLLQATKQVSTGISNFGQAINEGIVRALKSSVIAIGGEQVAKNLGNSAFGDFAKVATGRKNLVDNVGGVQLPQAPAANESIPTYQDIYKLAHTYAIENKATPTDASSFGSLAVLGVMFADNPLVGPEGSGFKLSIKAVEDLTKLTDESAIKALLKAENPGLNATQLEVLTPIFRDAKDAASVKKAVTVIESLKKPEGLKSGYLSRPAEHPPTPKEIYEMVHGAGDIPEGTRVLPQGEKVDIPPLTRAAERASEQNAAFDDEIARQAAERPTEPIKPVEAKVEIPKTETPKSPVLETLPPHAQALIEEARTPFKEVGQTRSGYENARDFANNVSNKEFADIKEANDILQREHGITNFGDTSVAEIKGYKQDTALARAFYNYANSSEFGSAAATTIKDITPAVKRYSPNLLKTISKEDLPGPIADILQKEFPKVSRRVLDSVAARLKNMSRTSDIESLLNTLQKVSESVKNPVPAAARVASAVDDSQPKAIADLLSPEQKDAYLESVKSKTPTRDDAVFAQQEYDALWEQADQKIIDRYNELLLGREFLTDQVDVHPGKGLVKYVSKTTGRLPEVTGTPTIKSLTGSGKTVANSEFGRRGDDIVTELGYETPEEAQGGLEGYISMRDQLRSVEDELKQIRPRARAARVVQAMVEDVPVIAQKNASAIDVLADPETIRSKMQDMFIGGGQLRDLYRNFKVAFKDNYDEAKRLILDPFDKSKGEMVDEITRLYNTLEVDVVKKYGINRGSKESQAIMDYGEREIAKEQRVPGMNFDYTTREGLVKSFGRDKAEQIMQAEGWFKKQYNTLIDEANEVRAKIYPNNPEKLIPKRKDYFRHFKEQGGDIKELLSLFETPAGIDPTLAGISAETKPKSKFLSFAQQRLGQSSARDAVGGFTDYVPAFAYMKHIDPHIGNFRYLRRQLSENSPKPGVTEVLDRPSGKVVAKHKGINNFLGYLDDVANDLAGKSDPVGRFIQDKMLPGGRKTMKVINWTNSRIKSNQILGNAGSTLAQGFNLPQGIASAQWYMLPGAKRTMAGIFEKNELMEASAFLKERYAEPASNRFPMDMVNHPIKGSVERTKKVAGWLTQVLDEVSTKWVWNAHYDKAVAENIPNPIKYADDITRSLVGGRGIGEVPHLYKSALGKIVAPFMLETGNAWWVMKDFVNQKQFGALAVFFVASYIMNEGAQKVRGSRVIFDPINSLIDGAIQAYDEVQDDGDYERAAARFGGRQLGEILNNIPLGSTFAAAVPDQFSLPGIAAPFSRKEFFGEGDPGRYGNPLLVVSAWSDPLYKLVLPFGGAQVKKTKEAVQSMLSGQVETSAGKPSFKTPTDPVSVGQAFLFGKSATQEAQNAFDTRDDIYQHLYTQDAKRTTLNLDAEKAWNDIQNTKKTKGGPAAAAQLKDIATKDPQLAQAVLNVATQAKAGLDGTDRLVGMLGVENGERAKFIAEQIRKLSTPADKAAYLKDLAAKKLLTSQVVDQLTDMLTKK